MGFERETAETAYCHHHHFAQAGQTSLGNAFAIKEDDDGRNDDDDIFEECVEVGEFHRCTEAAAVFHHIQLVAVVGFQMFGEGEPCRQQQEKHHHDQVEC